MKMQSDAVSPANILSEEDILLYLHTKLTTDLTVHDRQPQLQVSTNMLIIKIKSRHRKIEN